MQYLMVLYDKTLKQRHSLHPPAVESLRKEHYLYLLCSGMMSFWQAIYFIFFKLNRNTENEEIANSAYLWGHSHKISCWLFTFLCPLLFLLFLPLLLPLNLSLCLFTLPSLLSLSKNTTLLSPFCFYFSIMDLKKRKIYGNLNFWFITTGQVHDGELKYQ